MEYRYIETDEIDMLLESSSSKNHPFFYRFCYKPNKGFIAYRMKKNSLNLPSRRREFHQIDLDPEGCLARSIDLIDSKKQELGVFSNA